MQAAAPSSARAAGSSARCHSGADPKALHDPPALLVFQPGAATPVDLVPNDRVCHMVEGLLRVRLGGQEVVLKKGHVWASPKGAAEGRSNTGASVAVVRVIDLLPW